LKILLKETNRWNIASATYI